MVLFLQLVALELSSSFEMNVQPLKLSQHWAGFRHKVLFLQLVALDRSSSFEMNIQPLKLSQHWAGFRHKVLFLQLVALDLSQSFEMNVLPLKLSQHWAGFRHNAPSPTLHVPTSHVQPPPGSIPHCSPAASSRSMQRSHQFAGRLPSREEPSESSECCCDWRQAVQLQGNHQADLQTLSSITHSHSSAPCTSSAARSINHALRCVATSPLNMSATETVARTQKGIMTKYSENEWKYWSLKHSSICNTKQSIPQINSNTHFTTISVSQSVT